MNSNDLLKNFPTKSWGKVFLQKNKKLRIGYLPFQKGFAANLCFPSHLWVSELRYQYEGLTRERVNWLEEDGMTIVFDANPNP